MHAAAINASCRFNYRLFAPIRPLKRALYCSMSKTENSDHGTMADIGGGLQLDDPGLVGGSSFVDGAFCKGGKGEVIVTNPANDGIVRRVSAISPADLSRAVSSAARAFPGWRNTPAKEREALLRAWSAHMTAAKQDLARLITLENGKPIAEAVAEVDYSISYVDWYASEAVRGEGSSVLEIKPGLNGTTFLEPVGVVLAISPWNFPAAMIARKISPALAAGCTAIGKPSVDTPLTCLALAELAHRAGIPPGVFNVVISKPGHAGETASQILSQPAVRLVSFTGSTRVGIELAKVAANRVLRTCFELGGNAPFIIYDDANLDLAIDDLMMCKFRATGQVCISCNRVYVQDSVYENVINRLRPRLEALQRRMGNGLREDVALGPLTPKRAMGRIEAVVKDAISKGAKVEFGGHRGFDAGHTDLDPPERIRDGAGNGYEKERDGGEENGNVDENATENSRDEGVAASSWGVKPDNFYAPTLLSNVHDNMDMYSQEIFGPIIPLYRFRTEAEVLDRAGRVTAEDSSGGLAAYVYTRSHSRGKRAVRELHVGMVGLNSIQLSDPRTTFGGVGLSGIGREGGPGLEEYCEKKFYVDRYDID